MRPVLELIERVGPSDANVLITGEHGTGKGVVARRCTRVSPRAGRPLVDGQRRRAVRGRLRERAVRPREGRLHRRQGRSRRPLRAGRRRHALPRRDRERAAEPAGQAAARARDRRVRARRARRARARVDVRIISATNADLRRRWRPAASARTCSSASTRSRSTCRRCASGARTSRCSPRTSCGSTAQRYRKPLARLRRRRRRRRCSAHAWPGNVRELDHAVERAVLMARGDAIRAARPRAAPAGAEAPRARGHEPRGRRGAS